MVTFSFTCTLYNENKCREKSARNASKLPEEKFRLNLRNEKMCLSSFFLSVSFSEIYFAFTVVVLDTQIKGRRW